MASGRRKAERGRRAGGVGQNTGRQHRSPILPWQAEARRRSTRALDEQEAADSASGRQGIEAPAGIVEAQAYSSRQGGSSGKAELKVEG